jgi:hypothetical protein
VDGTDVYAAGLETINGTLIAKVWKNGVATTLSTDYGSAESVVVSGGDVYVAGYETENNLTVSKLWKNGVGVALSTGSNNAAAYSVAVK